MTCEAVVTCICKVIRAILSLLYRIRRYFSSRKMASEVITRINLGCGTQRIPGYLGIDSIDTAEHTLELSHGVLPFDSKSLDSVICMSAINYFTHKRASELIREVYRVLRPGGIARFGVQDLKLLARYYVEGNREFFFQTLPDGKDRFEGRTIGDKFASWFYGYVANGFPCRYVFDYESLSVLFVDAGFSVVERKAYRESRLENIELIDNRPEQMFFLEAVK